jgi:riboflavin kinase/FMN adenylyltransferase
VRNALGAGEIELARRFLGRPYAMTGAVVRGDGLGRKLGYPTANVRIKQNVPPIMGIFAVEVAGVTAAPLRGVASLGVRPTVKQQARPVLEVYLLDFSGDLYGKRVRVDFLHKFRDVEKFADLATLTHQIAVDVSHARGYFEGLDAATRSA